MAFWLFKSTPKEYRLDDRLTDPNPDITWTVKRHLDKIAPEDLVFLWVSSRNRGVRAVMRVEKGPSPMTEPESEQRFWGKPDTEIRHRVVGKLIHRVNLPATRLRGVPKLDTLPVKQGTQGTNFRVKDAAGQELLRLVSESYTKSDLSGEDPAYLGGLPKGNEFPEHKYIVTRRVVRDTVVGSSVKSLHDFHCQVCGERLRTPNGSYAEAAHIRPLSGEHQGPDLPENVLCLCPNHHVLFDSGAFSIADDMTLLGIDGSLRTKSGHTLNPEQLKYHRTRIYRPA